MEETTTTIVTIFVKKGANPQLLPSSRLGDVTLLPDRSSSLMVLGFESMAELEAWVGKVMAEISRVKGGEDE